MKIEIYLPPRAICAAGVATAGIAVIVGILYPDLGRAMLLLLGITIPGAVVVAGLFRAWEQLEYPDTRPEKGWLGATGPVGNVYSDNLAPGEGLEGWKGTDHYVQYNAPESVYLETEEDVREDAAEVHARRVKKARVLKPGREGDLEINDN